MPEDISPNVTSNDKQTNTPAFNLERFKRTAESKDFNGIDVRTLEGSKAFRGLGMAPIFGENERYNLNKAPLEMQLANEEMIKAKNQSWLSQTANMLGQAVVGEIIGGGIQGIGAIADIPFLIHNRATGQDEDFRNWITDIGTGISNFSQKEMPIYRTNPNAAFDVGDYGWWSSNGVSVASTLSLLIPGLGTSRGVAMATRGIGNLVRFSRAANIASKGNFITKVMPKIIPMLGDKGKYWRDVMSNAVAMRHAENFRESNGVVLQAKQESLDMFGKMDDTQFQDWKNSNNALDDEDKSLDREQLSNKIASEAGWRSYDVNATNIVFDVLQSQLLFGLKPGSKIKGGRGKLYNSNGIKTSINQAQSDLLGNSVPMGKIGSLVRSYGQSILKGSKFELSEGAEELINYMGNQEGMHYAKVLMNKDDGSNFYDRVSKYAQDPHAWEAAAWGVAGGAVFSKAASIYGWASDKMKGTDRNAFGQNRITEIQSRVEFIKKMYEGFEAIDNGVDPYNGYKTFDGDDNQVAAKKEEAKQRIQNDAVTNMWLNASHYGNADLLESYFASPKFMQDNMEKHGLTEMQAIAFSKNAIQTGREVEDAYNRYANKFKTSSANQAVKDLVVNTAVRDEVNISRLKKEYAKATNNSTKLKASDPSYISLRQKNKDVDTIIDVAAKQYIIAQLEEEAKGETNSYMQSIISSKLKELREEVQQKNESITDKQTIQQLAKNGLDPQHLADAIDANFYELSGKVMVEKLNTETSEQGLKRVQRELESDKKVMRTQVVKKLKDDLNKLTVDDDLAAAREGFRKRYKDLGFEIPKSEFDYEKRLRDLEDQKRKSTNTKPTEDVKTETTTVTDNTIETSKKEEVVVPTGDFDFEALSSEELIKVKEIESLISQGENQAALDRINYQLKDIKEWVEDMEADPAQFANFKAFLLDRQKIVTEPGEDSSDIQYDVDYLNEVNRNQGGPGSANIFLPIFRIQGKAKEEPINNSRTELGDVVIEDATRAAEINFILNSLKVGDQATIQIDEEKLKEPKFSALKNDKKNIPLKIVFPGNKSKGYANTSKYPEDEISLVDKVYATNSITGFIDPIYNDLVAVKGSNTEAKKEALDRLRTNKEFVDIIRKTNNKGVAEDDATVMKTFTRRTDHLIDVLFFGKNILKGEVPTELEIMESLNNWKEKMVRDLSIFTKVRDVIGVDTTKVVKASVSHRTTGNVIISRTKNGRLIYRALNETIGENLDDLSFDLLGTVKDDARSLAPFTTGRPEYVIENLKNRKYIAGREYIALKSGTKYVALPLIRTTIGMQIPVGYEAGELSPALKATKDYQTALKNKLTDLIYQLQPLLADRKTKFTDARLKEIKAQINNITIISENYGKKDEEDDGRFKIIIGGDKKVKTTEGEKDIDNRIQFKYNDKIVRIYFLQTGGINIEYDGKVTNNKEVEKEQFDSTLSSLFIGLERNVNHALLREGGDYFDYVENKMYKSYKEYIVKTGAIVTNIGKMTDGKGNKISNFTNNMENNRSKEFVGFPLIVNIKPKFNTEDELDEEQIVDRGEANKFKKFISNQIPVDSFAKLEPIIEKYQFLYDDAEANGINIVESIIPEFKDKFGNKVRGGFVPKTTTIGKIEVPENSVFFTRTFKNLATGDAKLTIYNHELVHGRIFKEINNDAQKKGKLFAELEDLWKTLSFDRSNGLKVTEQQKKDYAYTKYGKNFEELTGVQKAQVTRDTKFIEEVANNIESGLYEEFITYGLTEPAFAMFLASNKAEGTATETETFWSKLKKIILDFVNTLYEKTKLDELNELLDGFFEVNTELFKKDENKSDKSKGIDEVFGEDFNSLTNDVQHYAHNTKDTKGENPVYNTLSGDQSKYRSYITPGFTEAEENHLVNVGRTLFLEVTKDKDLLTEALGQGTGADAVRIAILTKLKATATTEFTESLSDEQADLFKRYVADLIKGDSQIWDKTLIQVNNEFGIAATDLDILSEEFLEKNWNDTGVFEISAKDTVLSNIKMLILTTPKADPLDVKVDEEGNTSYGSLTKTLSGLSESISFNVAYNTIQNAMLLANDKEGMLDKIKFLAKYVDVSYYHIYNQLAGDEQLLNGWYYSFNKQRPKVVSDFFTKIGNTYKISVDYTNKKSLYEYLLADELVNKIQDRTVKGYYTPAVLNGITIKVNKLLDYIRKIQKTNSARLGKDLAAIYKDLGIDITKLDLAIQEELDSHANRKSLASLVPKDVKNTNDYIRGIGAKRFISSIEYIQKYIQEVNDNPNIDVTFNQFGNIVNLAKMTMLFNEHRTDNTYMNVKGNLVQSVFQIDFISQWFKNKNTEEKFMEFLLPYTKVPRMQYSNWLWADELKGDKRVKNTFGLIDYEVIDGKKVPISVNAEAFRAFDYMSYGGSKNTTTGRGAEYADLMSGDWQVRKLIHYFNSVARTDNNSNIVSSFNILPADRGRTIAINHGKVKLDSKHYKALKDKDYTTLRQSAAWKAVYRTVLQEFEDMKQAMTYMFEQDEDGNNKTDEDGDIIMNFKAVNNLVKNYHYKEGIAGDKSSIKKRIKTKNFTHVLDTSNLSKKNSGDELGNVFKFNNIPELNTIEAIFDSKGLLDVDAFINNIEAVKTIVDKFTYNLAASSYKNNKELMPDLEGLYEHVSSNVTHALAEYGINHYLAKVEIGNFFGGHKAFYKTDKDLVKRNTQTEASGNSNASTGSFTAITIADVYWQSENLKVLRKYIKDDKIYDKFLDINLGDAQSYITLNEYENRLKINGKYNEFKPVLDKLKKGYKLNNDELVKVLSPLKEFYFSYKYDDSLGIFVPVQVKNSAQVLILQLLQGTSLSALAKFMNDNNIHQVNFASAEKVGSKGIVTISKNGKMLPIEQVKEDLLANARSYFYEDLITQQELPYHVQDNENKLGVQIKRKILDNINTEGNYGGIKGHELVATLFALYNSNITDSSAQVEAELGVTVVDGIPQVNMTNVINILKKEALARGLDNNTLFALEQTEDGNPLMPLYYGALQRKWMSIMTSLFTNNITNQKFPGMHVAQMSNVFMEKYAGKEIKVKNQSDYKTPFRKLKSQVLKKNEVIKAEVLLPAWSRQFYQEDGTLISIDELKKAGLTTMIGYRIPTEGKYSTIVFEVVGFLPEEQGATIVLPDDFITQSGSDFDIDSIYTMQYTFTKEEEDKFVKVPYLDDSNSTVEQRLAKFNLNKITKDYKSDLFMNFTTNRLKKVVKEDGKKLRVKEISEIKNKFIYNKDKTVNTQLLDRINKARYTNNKDGEVLIEFIPADEIELATIFKGVLTEYNAFLKEKRVEDFGKQRIEDQNIREARNNKILDLFISVLTAKQHYNEIVNPNAFDDITSASKRVQELLGVSDNTYNLYTDEGDNYYRNRVMEGRTLKGYSVNRDGFLSVAQRSRMQLRNDLSILVKYPKDMLPQLSKLYYKENISETEKDVIIKHNMIGFTKDGSQLNVEGKLITNYAAESTSNTLDNVKDPLPENVNPYTFGIWRTFVDLGTSYDMATAFIRQPIIKDLSDTYTELTGISGDGKGREIEETKRYYQTELYKLMKTNKLLPNKDNGLEPMYYETKMVEEEDKYGDKVMVEVKSDKLIYGIKGFDQSIADGDYIFVDRNDTKKIFGYDPNIVRAFSQIELDELLKHSKKLGTNAKLDVAYYQAQLQTLEAFRVYKKSTEGIEDANRAFNVDKIGAGPDLAVTHALINLIRKIDDYHDEADEFMPMQEGARVLIFGDSAVRHIYGKPYDNESMYSPLETYLNESNINSLNILGRLFISETIGYRFYLDSLLMSIGKEITDEKTIRKAMNYADAYLLSDHPFFNIGQEEWLRLLGRASNDNTNIDLKDASNLNEFQKLPVSLKLDLVKERLHDDINLSDVTNVLNYIQPSINEKDKYLKLNWINNDKDNYMIESFNRLYYGNNVFVTDLMKDLILYSYWESGMNFTYNSWSKIIPINILVDDLRLGEHLQSKFDMLDNNITGFSSSLIKSFKQANADDADVVPLARTIVYKKGEKKGEPRKGFPVWKPKPNGIITITRKSLENEGKAIQTADVIKLSEDKKGKFLQMTYEDQFDNTVNGKKTKTTRLTDQTFVIGDEVNVWNGKEGKEARYISVKVINVTTGKASQMYNEISELDPNDAHFEKEGYRNKTIHLANLKYMKGSPKTATQIEFEVIGKVSEYPQSFNRAYTIYKRVEDNDSYYYYPISKLEQYEFGTQSAIQENNVGNAESFYLTKIFPNGQQSDSNTTPDDLPFNSLSGETREQIIKDAFYSDIHKFIKEYKIDVLKDLSAYAKTANRSKFYDNLKGIKDKLSANELDIRDWNDIELREALLAIIEHNTANIFGVSEGNVNTSILDKLRKLEHEDYTTGTPDELITKTKALTNFLWNTKLFTEGMLKIRDLTQMETTEEDVLGDTGIALNKLIKELKEQYARIEDIDKRANKLFNEHLARRIAAETSNPEIQENIKNAFKPTRDLNKFQLQLDALMDADNPIIANFAKFYTKEVGKADMEAYETTSVFDEEYDKFIKAGGNVNDIFQETKDGEKTGRFVQEFMPEVYEEFREEWNKVKESLKKGIKEGQAKEVADAKDYAKATADYIEARYNFEKWKRNNLEQEFVDAFYDIQLLLTPEARKVRHDLNKEIEQIMSKYYANAHFDHRDITIEDRRRLRQIKKQKIDYQNPDKHPEIAKSWNEYNDALDKLKYDNLTFKQQFYDDYKKANRAGGTRPLYDFIIRNTTPTKEFWAKYEELTKELFGDGESEAEKHTREYIDELLEPYKDDNGLVIGTIVPKKVLKEVRELEALLDELRKSSEFDETKANLWAQYDALVTRLPTEYYWLEREKQVEKLRKKGVEDTLMLAELKETKWYKENHKEKKGKMVPINRWTKMMPAKNKFFYKDGVLKQQDVAPRKEFIETVLSKEFINLKYKKTDNNVPTPKDKWKDKRYDKINNNETTKEFYDYITKLTKDLVSLHQGNILEDGYIPAAQVTNKGIFRTIGRKLGFYDLDRNDEMALFYKNNQQIRFLPLNFISLLKERQKYDYTEVPKSTNVKEYQQAVIDYVNDKYDTKFKEFKKILSSNKKIESFNKSLKSGTQHGANISYDLKAVMPAFITNATRYKYKKNIEAEVLLMRDYVANMEVQKITGRNKIVQDITKIYKGKYGTDEDTSQKVKASRYSTRFDKWLEMVFYDEFELDEGELTKYSRIAQNYISLKGIGLNPFSALNNIVYGRIQIAVESAAGYHFTKKDYLVGKKYWNGSVMNFIADTYSETEKATSLASGLTKYFDIIDDQTDRALADGKSKIHKHLMKTNAFYLMQHMGEHYMQNTVLFSMMNHYRIIDGKIVSLHDYRRDKLEAIDLDLPIAKLKEKAKERKDTRDALQKEFEAYPKVIEAFELSNGRIKLASGINVSRDEIANFKVKVKGVNQKLHGIYNKEDKGIINNIALGRMLMQFRHWVRPGWNKRWGTRFGQKSWNERRAEFDQGSYVSAFRFFTQPFKNKGKQNWSGEGEWTAYRAAMALVRDYGKFVKNAQVYWMIMDETERANVTRATLEMLTLIGTIALLAMIRGGADDDEELKDNFWFNAFMYQLDRTRSEVAAYMPITPDLSSGWFGESKKFIKSPTASWKGMEDSFKFLQAALQYPFISEEDRKYKSGVYHDKYKLLVLGSKQVPGLTVYQRALYLSSTNKYYRLF